jgi:hypothetical protein
MRRVLFAIAIAAVAAGSFVSAHHSYSAYHVDRLVEVEGVIDDFEWRAPHSLLRVKADDRILNFKSVRRLSDGWKWPNS